VKWTKRQPKVSGYYWLKEKEYLLATATEPRKPTGAYCTPKVVKVKISDDPEYPEASYSSCNYEMDWDFKEGDLWAGPIPLPKENQEQFTNFLYRLYKKKGQYAIYDYAKKHPRKFASPWTWCTPCEDDTPSVKSGECAVCGSVKYGTQNPDE